MCYKSLSKILETSMSVNKCRRVRCTFPVSISSLWRALLLALIVVSTTMTVRMLGFRFPKVRRNPAAIVLSSLMPYRAQVHPLKTKIAVDISLPVPRTLGLIHVQDVVSFPHNILLIVTTSSGPPVLERDGFECVFGSMEKRDVLFLDWKEPQKSIYAMCPLPLTVPLSSKNITLRYKGSNQLLASRINYTSPASWKRLVYDSVLGSDSLYLFVKGLVDSRNKPLNLTKSLEKARCVFGEHAHTPVMVVAQEVARCKLPPRSSMHLLPGVRVGLSVPKLSDFSSVAYFNPSTSTNSPKNKHFLCACTMIWNQARFLKEWVMHHGFLGVERWFLYDNNSDDDVHQVVEDLVWYNVTRHAWPWIKTQEAGFSHCAMRAKAYCKWVMFIDVDEFVFPARQLNQMLAERSSTVPSFKPKPEESTVLRRLINRQLQKAEGVGQKVGELRLLCHNFGPSGWVRAPEQGVMAGYTCRMRFPVRHKSFLLLDALEDSLLNVVHHFALKPGYRQMAIYSRTAVINHYKYQAWEVFKAKFTRRVATYVTDWQESADVNSNDKAPGLGTQPVEPDNWADSFCEEVDTGLRDFTLATFLDPESHQMLWDSPASNTS